MSSIEMRRVGTDETPREKLLSATKALEKEASAGDTEASMKDDPVLGTSDVFGRMIGFVSS
jgi:hypothetical protein